MKLWNLKKNKNITKVNRNKFEITNVITLSDFITIYSLNNVNNYDLNLENTKEFNSNLIDLGNSYVLNKFFDDFENYDLIFLLGFNPRFEASLLNTSLIRAKQNFNINVLFFSEALSNFYFDFNSGLHIKTLLLLLEGKLSLLSIFREFSQNKILIGSSWTKIFSSIDKMSLILNKYLLTKSIFISKNLGQLHFFEMLGSNNYISFKKNINKSVKNAWFINTPLNNKFKNVSTYVSLVTNNMTSLNKKKTFDKYLTTNYNLPISYIYEQNGFILPIIGKIERIQKIANTVKALSLSSWFFNFSLIKFEKKHIFWKQLNKNKKKFKLNSFNKNLMHNIYNNWYLNFSLSFIYYINSDTFINNHNVLYNDKKIPSYVYNGFGNLSVFNFYNTSTFLKSASTLTSLSYLTVNNLLLK